MRFFLGPVHQTIMNPAFIVHANRSLAFSLYEFYINGVPVEKLATAYALPVHSVEEKIRSRKTVSEASGHGWASAFAEKSGRGMKGKMLFIAFHSVFLCLWQRFAADLIYLTQR